MDLNQMINQVKSQIDFDWVGMIVTHNGVVRGTSRDGSKVTGLEIISVDQEKIDVIIDDIEGRPGIEAVLVDVAHGKLKVGDDILMVVVAGDLRDNVFPALVDTVNRIKKEAVTKKEIA
ncbi:MAG: molybdenum cofactor biosynthesis protein MoaE [Deltaproteobacteria bacterium]|nr:molybdenum cofactor biosynthesis protein MoaE [Deltaproteobacteria bacterium]